MLQLKPVPKQKGSKHLGFTQNDREMFILGARRGGVLRCNCPYREKHRVLRTRVGTSFTLYMLENEVLNLRGKHAKKGRV